MLLGLGTADVASVASISAAGGVNWNDWLKAGTDVARQFAPLVPSQYADQFRTMIGPTTTTPNVVAPPPPSTVQSFLGWITQNWPIALAVVAGGALLAARGRKRR